MSAPATPGHFRGHFRGRFRAVAAALAVVTGAGLLASLPSQLAAQASPATGESPIAASAGLDGRDSSLLFPRPSGGTVQVGHNIIWGTGQDNNSPACHPKRPICVHWTETGKHATPSADSDGDHIPDQVEKTLAAASASWKVLVGNLGFRAPLPDGRSAVNGGDNRLDIYLADTGSHGMAGYTSSDDPRLAKGSKYKFRDVSAFIVMDNDFRAGQFPGSTPDTHLRVTAAHELMHASEMAYDYREDKWLREGTAAWAEDEVFDGANLNRQYLQHSSLAAPGTPVDLGRHGHQYGSWIFLRYLSERFGHNFIAKVWRLADDSPQQTSHKNMQTYSMEAIRRALARDGHDFRKVFADFMRVNLKPVKGYKEGSTYPIPFSPRLPLSKHGEDTGWMGTTVDHLAATYVTFVPGDNAPPGRRLEISVNAPPRGTSPAAQVVIRFNSGHAQAKAVKLNKNGFGRIRVPFGRTKVANVDVALINASTRYSGCFKRGTSYSCRGFPRDNDRIYNVRAHVL